MVRYFNRKTVLSLMVAGGVALCVTGCGNKISQMPDIPYRTITTSPSSQDNNEYSEIETLIEESINSRTTPENTKCYSAVRVLGSHQEEGKGNQYDIIASTGIFHGEIYQREVYSIEERDTSKIVLAVVDINGDQVEKTDIYENYTDLYLSDDTVARQLEGKFTDESIDHLVKNSDLPYQLMQKKFMSAISTADYVTSAENFTELMTTGSTLCVNHDGLVVSVETKEKSSNLHK